MQNRARNGNGEQRKGNQDGTQQPCAGWGNCRKQECRYA